MEKARAARWWSCLSAHDRREPMAALDHFRQELHVQMQRATAWGANAVVINARDLHSAFGDFLEPKHQPRCSDVMEQEMIDGDVVVADKSDADGLTIRYRLPRAGVRGR